MQPPRLGSAGHSLGGTASRQSPHVDQPASQLLHDGGERDETEETGTNARELIVARDATAAAGNNVGSSGLGAAVVLGEGVTKKLTVGAAVGVSSGLGEGSTAVDLTGLGELQQSR